MSKNKIPFGSIIEADLELVIDGRGYYNDVLFIEADDDDSDIPSHDTGVMFIEADD